MEHAADALKLSFAMLVLVVLISVTFMTLSQAKATADLITYSLDITNFYPDYDLTPSKIDGINAMKVNRNYNNGVR